MYEYTEMDCDQIGAGCSLKGRVVVVNKAASLPGQLFFCIEGDRVGENPTERNVSLVSLSNGEGFRVRRKDVVGTLKPELLPDDAKLMLSQIRPAGAKDLAGNEPEFSGYSFLPDGRYAAGVWLCSPEEVMAYVEMQKPYQHRVLICDRDDFSVMEIIDGKLIYPDEQALASFQQEPDKGMTMT